MEAAYLAYPFTAVVGHEKLKLALILNVINPDIGGLLITGSKGTGKSTLVNSLMNLTPRIPVVEGCPFQCSPEDEAHMCAECRSRINRGDKLKVAYRSMRLIRVPLGTTEDRIIGTLDVERALKEGVKVFHPGLLAEANRNILYIDEVNLLRDHLVDAILDPAASGWSVVEREGVSVSHPSRFIFIASMNPEEGGLRPQLLDRFSLHAEAETIRDPDLLAEVVLRNEAYEKDPESFIYEYWPVEEELRKKIAEARRLLPSVRISRKIYESVARVCSELQVDGHRPDIVTIKAAKALAAFRGETEVTPEDVLAVSEFALSHRTRRSGLEAPPKLGMVIGSFRRAFAELKVVVEKVKIDWLHSGFLPPKVTSQIPGMVVSSQALKAVKRTEKKFSRYVRFAVPLLFALLLYLLSILTILVYFYLGGFPAGEVRSAISLEKTLPITIFYGAIFLVYHLISKRQTKPSIVFLYEPGEGDYPRRKIVPAVLSRDAPYSEGVVQLVPLKSKYLSRLKILIDYGKKVIEHLSQMKEPKKEGFSLSVEGLLRRKRGLVGKHFKTITSSMHGHYVWHELPKDRPVDIAIAPTLRAAAPNQRRRKGRKLLLSVEPQDIRVKVRESKTPLTILILLDVSESMKASLESVREALKGLRDSSFRRRDRVGLVIFKGSEAFLLQHPTTNINLILSKLTQVGASDYTPLAAGMLKALNTLRIEMRRNKDAVPIIIIITDGIANIPLKRPLSSSTRKLFINSAQADAVDVARLIAKEGVHSVVVNVNHRQEELEETGKISGWYEPTEFVIELTRLMGGKYYGITGFGAEARQIVLTDALATMPSYRRRGGRTFGSRRGLRFR